MGKRIVAAAAIALLLLTVLPFGAFATEAAPAASPEAAQEASPEAAPEEAQEDEGIPTLEMVYATDGSSAMKLSVKYAADQIDEAVNYFSQSLTEDGYTVEKIEGTQMVISRTFADRDRYVLDMSMFLPTTPLVEFVRFSDFFVSRHGIYFNGLDSKNQPEGQTYMILTLKTPGGASASNADEKTNGGRSHTWRIGSGKGNEVDLTFKTYNAVPIISTIFILAIAAFLIYILLTSKKRRQDALEQDEAEDGYFPSVEGEILPDAELEADEEEEEAGGGSESLEEIESHIEDLAEELAPEEDPGEQAEEVPAEGEDVIEDIISDMEEQKDGE